MSNFLILSNIDNMHKLYQSNNFDIKIRQLRDDKADDIHVEGYVDENGKVVLKSYHQERT